MRERPPVWSVAVAVACAAVDGGACEWLDEADDWRLVAWRAKVKLLAVGEKTRRDGLPLREEASGRGRPALLLLLLLFGGSVVAVAVVMGGRPRRDPGTSDEVFLAAACCDDCTGRD